MKKGTCPTCYGKGWIELKDNPNPPPEPEKKLTPDSIDFKR